MSQSFPPAYNGGLDAGTSSQVSGPALGLMINAGVGMLLQCLNVAAYVAFGIFGASVGGDEGAQIAAQSIASIPVSCISLVCGIGIIFGAMKMKNLESYNFAMAAAILSMIPCTSPCCLLGLPLGIWALMTLNDDSVKSAFRG